MSIDLTRLNSMEPDALRALAVQMGVVVHHKAGKEKLVTAITEKALASQAPTTQPDGAPVIQPTAPVHHNTPEQVEVAIASIKARQPRFVSKYDEEENTWLFQCLDASGRVGCEEAGNLSIPLRVIVRQANSVSLGRRQLMGLNEHFDKTAAGGHNAYTNTVLA